MNSVKTLIVVGGLAAGLVGGAWAWTNSQSGNSDANIAANGIEQSTVSAESLIASNTKLNEELSLPAMYAAVPLSRSATAEESTRAPEPPELNSVDGVVEIIEENLAPSVQPIANEPEGAAIAEAPSVIDSPAAELATSPSGQATADTALLNENVAMPSQPIAAPSQESRPVDYGRLNQRLIQVADALERLNLRLAALSGPREAAPTADASEAPEVSADTNDPAEG